MSTISQTPRAGSARLLSRIVVSGLLVVGVIWLALGPVGPAVLRIAGQGRLHAPNLAIWSQLSLPIQIHLLTALAALVLGAILMTARKGRRFHRVAGWAWVSLVSATAGATLFIRELAWAGGWPGQRSLHKKETPDDRSGRRWQRSTRPADRRHRRRPDPARFDTLPKPTRFA